MADIKLFVCCHQPTEVPKHPLLVPIQVGAALANSHFPGFLYDDTGDNISAKNRSYCELTAQYWAWKNVDADYYGFFHYRRYLYPDKKAKWPYRIERKPELSLLNKLDYENFSELIQGYDMILPMGENMYIPVREHYAKAKFHHKGDLDLIEQIVRMFSPEYADAMEKYLSGTICYFGNIFIMKRHIFYDYCTWIFHVLEEFDFRSDTTHYNSQERRVDGYLSERLFGVWLSNTRNFFHVLELPKVHFEPDVWNLCNKRLINLIFPPGSRRRARIKQIRGD